MLLFVVVVVVVLFVVVVVVVVAVVCRLCFCPFPCITPLVYICPHRCTLATVAWIEGDLGSSMKLPT